jgi:uncharacterized protein (TIGR00730 family)
MEPLSSLCVYCGSATGVDPTYREAAVRLGRLMAENRIRLVYGGGRVGLMGVLADSVIAHGGSVAGVIPRFLETREVGHRGVSELHIVDSMHIRKNLMFELSDAFAVLPGGFGTLDETFEIITWRQLKLHDKPIVLVDAGGYWQPFLNLVDHVIGNGLARPECRALFTVVSDVDEVIAAIRREPEPAVPDLPERL